MNSEAFIVKAFAFQQAGRNDLAMLYYKTGLIYDPASPDALHMLAVVYKSLGRPLAALRLLAWARQANSSLFGLGENIALAVDNAVRIAEDHYTADRIAEASALLHAIIALVPCHGWSHLKLGMCLWREGRRDQAHAALWRGEMLTVPHGDAAPLHAFAQEQLAAQIIHDHQAGLLEKAAAGYRRFLALYPANYDGLRLSSIACRQIGAADAALRWVLRTIRVAPQYQDTQINLTKLLMEFGRYEEGLDVIRPYSRTDDAQLHLLVGNLFSSLKRTNAAIAAYRNAMICNPANPDILFHLTENTIKTADPTAKLWRNRLFLIDPYNIKLYILLYKRLKDVNKNYDAGIFTWYVFNLIRSLIERDPSNYGLWIIFGTIQMDSGLFCGALMAFNKSTVLSNDKIGVLNNILTIISNLNRFHDYIEKLHEYNITSENKNFYFFNAAYTAVLIEKFDLAIDFLKHGIQATPDRLDYQDWLHYLELHQGRREKAFNYFQSRLAADPHAAGALIGLGTMLLESDPIQAWVHFSSANLAIASGNSDSVLAPHWIFGSFDGVVEALSRLSARPQNPFAAPLEFPQEKGTAFFSFRRIPTETLSNLPQDDAFHRLEGATGIEARRVNTTDGVVSLAPILAEGITNEVLTRNFMREWSRRHPEVMENKTLNGGNDVILRYTGAYLAPMLFQGRQQCFVLSQSGDFIEDSWNFDEIATATNKRQKRVLLPFGDSASAWVQCRIDDAVDELPEAACLLGGFHYFHYGCWLTEILPKISIYNAMPETCGLPLILPAPLDQLPPFVGESLQALDIAPERLHFFTQHTSRAATLYYAIKTDRFPRTAALKWVREQLLARLKPEKTPTSRPRRLFLSRRDSAQRNIFNAYQFQLLLDEFGFTEVVGGELTLMEKVAAFANAEAIIGVSGAGMANVIFAPPGALVVEIGALSFFCFEYACMSQSMNLRFHRVFGIMEGPNQDICVPIETLRQLLSENLSSQGGLTDVERLV